MASSYPESHSPNGEYVFRPRATIMRTLGRELISSEAVALIELVKNAYDADATRVLIKFVGPIEEGNGRIDVSDNGHGMSMSIVERAWMEPATNNKRVQTHSEKYKRKLLGEKGIGRFASSRLAKELELTTKRASQTEEIYALFDWTQFDDESRFLDQIEILVEQREPVDIRPDGPISELWASERAERPSPTELNHGTILRMSKLNKDWLDSDFQDLQRDLSRLVSPFAEFSDFRIRLELPPPYSEYSKEITPPDIIKYPHYSIRGEVQEDGRYKLTLEIVTTGVVKHFAGQFIRGSDPQNPTILMVQEDDAKKLLDSLSPEQKKRRRIQTGRFDVELRIWDRDELGNVVQRTDSTIKSVRKDLDAIAGVNIYRDNFRVLPYGEPHDDWLRLDMRRVQNPTKRLSNNQIVGYVSISSEYNPQLKDQSNREGLDDNQALKDLRQVLLLLLNEVESARYPLRRQRGKQPSAKPVQGLFGALDLSSLRHLLAVKYPDDQEIQALVNNTQSMLTTQIEEIQVVISRYQRLATLGTLIDVILHDGRHPLSEILRQAIIGQDSIKDADIQKLPLLSKLRDRFKTIEESGNLLTSVFGKVEPFGGRRRGRPASLYLEDIIKDAVELLESQIVRLGVEIELPKSETIVRVERTEIEQVIINLLQNSLFWLDYVEPSRRKISIEVTRVAEDRVEIIFKDTGPGIPAEHREQIFDPYFSTKPNGVGLGLTIAGEIVSDYYNGKLELLDSIGTVGTTFRIVLRKRV